MLIGKTQEWTAARARGVGGSECASLLQPHLDVEYGCRRRLWYSKSGVEPDNPRRDTIPMLLGNLLESLARRLYSAQTGRRVDEVESVKHPLIDCLRVNVDGIIHPAPGDTRGPGTLEVKCVGRDMMRKINEEGLPLDYLCQNLHGQAVHDHSWGSFAIGVREDLLGYALIEQASIMSGEPMPVVPRPKISTFDIERSDSIIELIEREAEGFWLTLGDESRMPPSLEDEEDPRCGRCDYQIRCRGREILESAGPEESRPPRRNDLVQLQAEYVERAVALKKAEDAVEETKDKWKEALGPIPAVSVPVDGGWKNVIYRARQGRTTVDANALAAQYESVRLAAIKEAMPGADLIPAAGVFNRKGMPSRPLLLSSLLPKEPRKKGSVSEVDDVE